MKQFALTAGVIFSIFLAGLPSVSQAAAPQQFNSLRGGVYEDIDGDGLCDAGQPPVANVDLLFSQGLIQIPLFSGADGSFGMVAVGPGLWVIQVIPPAGWTVTSAATRTVAMSNRGDQVTTGINFCLRRDGGTNLSPSADSIADDLVSRLAAANVSIPAANDYSEDAAATRAIISEILLTDPEPTPLEEVQEMAPMLPEPEVINEPWLNYLNIFREMGGLPLLVNSDDLSLGAQMHSRYMVVNDKPIAHSQDPANPLFSEMGLQAAENSDIFATTQLEATHEWAINFWISAPFHLVPIIDPGLNSVGYGQHNQNTGTFKMSAALDVLSDRNFPLSGGSYPLIFPANGSETWVLRHSLYEWPDPLASCGGYARPTGPSIVLQMGNGEGSPRVTSFAFSQNGEPVEACLFTETTYSNPDFYAQQTGRLILDERDAVVIIPRRPLAVGESYQVEVVVDGETHSWEFQAVSPP
ncbi:MAG: CAP domain-containing protein [Ardenticatenaceae bacterium]|nr:CAP domain-containing protein [Ardenticatenaceae bacterium]